MMIGATTWENKPNHGHTDPPYRPSWVDLLTAWVGRLPGPSWLYYFGLGLVLFALLAAVAWLERLLPVGTILPIHVFLAAVIPFFLALFYYLDKRAGTALAMLRPALAVDEEEYGALAYQLTTLPARPTFLASLAILAITLLTERVTEPYLPAILHGHPLSANLFRLVYLSSWWLFGAFLYHTAHQLRLIHHIYTQYTRVNLFRMKPLYAFSVLSALTAGSLAAIIYGWLATAPSMPLSDPVVFIWVSIFIITALITFLWPQLGMHRLQDREQERLMDEAYLRLEATIAKLHRQVDEGDLAEMENLNYAIASLEIELNLLKSIRTWPWEPETLQILFTALALPLGLWMIQAILERVLGA